jgi:hypothetical protein
MKSKIFWKRDLTHHFDSTQYRSVISELILENCSGQQPNP